MTFNLITIVAFVTTAIATGACIFFWRRSVNLYALLVEGANRFEELRNTSDQKEKSFDKLETKAGLHRQETRKLESELNTAREQNTDLVSQLESKENATRLVAEKLELQKGHLQKQADKLTAELDRAHTSLSESDTKIAELTTEFNTKNNDEIKRLKKKLEIVNTELKNEKETKKADPIELKKAQRRGAQFERLYNSMKGLREMADERSANWEIALAKLATWILNNSNTKDRPIPDKIGPLVGDALNTIGEGLIRDDFSAESKESPEVSTDTANEVQTPTTTEAPVEAN